MNLEAQNNALQLGKIFLNALKIKKVDSEFFFLHIFFLKSLKDDSLESLYLFSRIVIKLNGHICLKTLATKI